MASKPKPLIRHERGFNLLQIMLVVVVGFGGLLTVLLIFSFIGGFGSRGRALKSFNNYLSSTGFSDTYNVIGCNHDSDGNGYATCSATLIGGTPDDILEMECPTTRRNNICRVPRVHTTQPSTVR